MMRVIFSTGGALALMLAVAGFSGPVRAADEGMIGKMTIADFVKENEAGAAKIKGIVVDDKTALSAEDLKWLGDVRMAAMLQEQTAKAALEKSESVDVKTFAKGEVQVQGALVEKLEEIATAKGAALPEALGEKEAMALSALKAKSGKGFDAGYLVTSASKGNSELWALMTKAEKNGKDSKLKEVVATALPLIRMHTKTAKGELEDDD